MPGNSYFSDADNQRHFEQEVAAMNALRFHPNIIRLLGFVPMPQAIITPIYSGDLFAFLHKRGTS